MTSLNSIRLRLALASAAVILTVGAGFGAISQAWLRTTLESEVQTFAQHEAHEVANLVASLETREQILARQSLFDGLFPEDGVVGLAIFSTDGRLVFSLPAEPGPWSEPWPEGFRAARAGEFLYGKISHPGMPDSVRTALRVKFGIEPRWLVVATVSEEHAQALAARYRTIFGGSLLLAVGIGFLSGLVLPSLALRPLRGMVEDTARLARGEPGRLAEPPEGSELRELAVLLNQMVEHHRRSLEGLRLFTSQAGHELRTPLARLRAEAEGALARGDEAQLREAIASMLDESASLERVIEGLLELARVEASELKEVERVPLEPMLAELAQQAREVGAPREVRLSGCEGAPGAHLVLGSRVLLERALWNLLDNAIKFGKPSGRIDLRLRGAADALQVEVADDGAGLSEAESATLFEPFQRGARTQRETTGHGLGLSLARAIVRRHGGEIEVGRDGELGGARFVVRLPRVGS